MPKLYLNMDGKWQNKLLGEGSYFEEKYKHKIDIYFNRKNLKRFSKSTHVSYIEKEVDRSEIENADNTAYRPTSSFTKRSMKPMESYKPSSRNTNYQKYRSNQILEENKVINIHSSTKVIKKSNKRKIFVGNESKEKERENVSNVSENMNEKDSRHIDEDMLNSALERIKKETEEKYEKKLKKMMEDMTREHQLSLGKKLLFKN